MPPDWWRFRGLDVPRNLLVDLLHVTTLSKSEYIICVIFEQQHAQGAGELGLWGLAQREDWRPLQMSSSRLWAEVMRVHTNQIYADVSSGYYGHFV
jgi:hypothetical protein